MHYKRILCSFYIHCFWIYYGHAHIAIVSPCKIIFWYRGTYFKEIVNALQNIKIIHGRVRIRTWHKETDTCGHCFGSRSLWVGTLLKWLPCIRIRIGNTDSGSWSMTVKMTFIKWKISEISYWKENYPFCWRHHGFLLSLEFLNPRS